MRRQPIPSPIARTSSGKREGVHNRGAEVQQLQVLVGAVNQPLVDLPGVFACRMDCSRTCAIFSAMVLFCLSPRLVSASSTMSWNWGGECAAGPGAHTHLGQELRARVAAVNQLLHGGLQLPSNHTLVRNTRRKPGQSRRGGTWRGCHPSGAVE